MPTARTVTPKHAALLMISALLLTSTAADTGERPARHRRQDTSPPPWDIAIVESTSQHEGHVMDTEWLKVATALGHRAAIVPQTFLDDPRNLKDKEILIVASGLIDLPTQRRHTMERFLRSGGGLYLQSEYMVSHPGNVAFVDLVERLDGHFQWTGEVSGDLASIAIRGPLSHTPEPVSSLPYYWWGCQGRGLEAFLTWQSQDVGFAFCPARDRPSMILTTSDQDWIKNASSHPESVALMKNIIWRLGAERRCTSRP